MKKLLPIVILMIAGLGAAHADPKLKSQSMSDQELDEVAAGLAPPPPPIMWTSFYQGTNIGFS